MEYFAYPAAVTEAGPEDFVASFRDISEAITGGSTRAEALTNAGDALAAAVEGYLEQRKAPPHASPTEAGETLVPLEVSVAARVLLLVRMERDGLSGRALAARLGKSETAVRRMLSGKAASLEQVLGALRELGERPVLVSLAEAA